MRIVAVTAWFPTPRAPGRGLAVAGDVAALAAHPALTGLEVVHLVPPRQHDGDATTDLDGVRVRRVPMHPLNPLDWARAAREVAALTQRADVVHSMGSGVLAPLLLQRRRPQPWLHSEHRSDPADPTAPLGRRAADVFLGIALRVPATVTVTSERAARAVRRARYPRRTAVVGRAVAIAEHPSPRPMRPHSPLRLLGLAEPDDREAAALAIGVIAELRARGVAAHLTWLGGGRAARTVKRLARRRRLRAAVTLQDDASRGGLDATIEGTDLVLLTGRQDGEGFSAAAALAAGRPVVAAAAADRDGHVTPPVGALVTERRAAAFADAVVDIDRRSLHLTAGEVAATVADLTPDQIAERYVAEYRHLLRSR